MWGSGTHVSFARWKGEAAWPTTEEREIGGQSAAGALYKTTGNTIQ